MKILQIVDYEAWAIGHLAKDLVKYNPQFEWRTVYVHPKHVAEHLDEVRQWVGWADIIDYQYWNSARQLMELIPELRGKKSVLTHHNEKDLLSADWHDINILVGETQASLKILHEAGYKNLRHLPLAVDLAEFPYNETLPDTKVVGYAGRIVPWKGLKELARACYELNLKLLFMGKFDKPDYWNSIPPEHQAVIDLKFMDCKDEDRKNFYANLDIFVQNSGPGRETGTLPLMEAMASGVPVLTTPTGIAADIISDRENGVLTPVDDYEALKGSLAMLATNNALKEKIRKNAWDTIKVFTPQRRAWDMEKIYHEVFSPDPLVSVIIPTTKDRDTRPILEALKNSEYKHIEAVVIYDQTAPHDPVPGGFTFGDSLTVKIANTNQNQVYGLAMARNIGAIDARGEYLVFCDSRLVPDPLAITLFVETFEKLRVAGEKKKLWLFGNKGSGKKTFIENFSCIRRADFIKAGMCNERVNRYGGMSQELRARFNSQGFSFEYLEDAMATPLVGTHLTSQRRADIVRSKFQLYQMGLL